MNNQDLYDKEDKNDPEYRRDFYEWKKVDPNGGWTCKRLRTESDVQKHYAD